MQRNLIVAILFVVFISCNIKIDSETYSEFQKKGDEISSLAQATLLTNVGRAIQTGGPEYAVEFCNLKASSLVDSLNQANNCTISRVSAKNRNPENKLSDALDKKIWDSFQNGNKKDTVVSAGKTLVYYKTIKTAMPACLKCHGNRDTDINTSTLEKLQELYPNDLATGYALNEFRGLWKIEFAKN